MANGRVTISRYTSNQSEGGVTIEFTDVVSGTRFAKVELTLKNFAMCVTGLGETECELEVRGLDVVGMKAEYKTEQIEGDQPFGDKKKIAAITKKVQALEVDGWKARMYDIDNGHNWKKGFCSVAFFRHVDVKEQV